MRNRLGAVERLRRWTPHRFGILVAAIVLTGLNTAAIPIFGLKKWQRLLGRLTNTRDGVGSFADPEHTIDRAMTVMIAAHRRRLLPGSCLARSLALQTILARSGVVGDLRVGVRRDGTGVAAHAWVQYGDQRLDLDGGPTLSLRSADSTVVRR